MTGRRYEHEYERKKGKRTQRAARWKTWPILGWAQRVGTSRPSGEYQLQLGGETFAIRLSLSSSSITKILSTPPTPAYLPPFGLSHFAWLVIVWLASRILPLSLPTILVALCMLC